jgi:hypothetical protein
MKDNRVHLLSEFITMDCYYLQRIYRHLIADKLRMASNTLRLRL